LAAESTNGDDTSKNFGSFNLDEFLARILKPKLRKSILSRRPDRHIQS